MIRFAPVLLLLAGCSLTAPTPPGPVLYCAAAECPPLAEVERVLSLFRDRTAATFNPHEPLAVYWYEPDHDFGFESPRGGRVIGYTPTPNEVHVTGMRTLVHEVMHVHLWRSFPEYQGDGDHEAGEGPWTEATNESVRTVLEEAGY